MKMIKFGYKKGKAVMFTVSMPKKVEDYALVFLQMFNNVREYPHMFYRIENNSANSVFITCRTSDKESVRNWIEAFNDTEIIYEEEVIRFIVDADYDSKGYNEIYGGGIDEVQFYTEIE